MSAGAKAFRVAPVAVMLAAFTMAGATGALAQQGTQSSRPTEPPPVTSPVEPSPPYEPQLLRLAEVMGALAYLRDLCGLRDGDKWRTRMSALLDVEATSEARKERLAGAYNKGFTGYESTYRSCTPNAELVIERYLDEGGKLARDVTSRYGGG